jgi:hypothetical protein
MIVVFVVAFGVSCSEIFDVQAFQKAALSFVLPTPGMFPGKFGTIHTDNPLNIDRTTDTMILLEFDR